ncbi:MAG: thioredoxin family protein [Planctomycetes bacterium]|nr:thioredoxin family protein [Planctomycetota bacterium]
MRFVVPNVLSCLLIVATCSPAAAAEVPARDPAADAAGAAPAESSAAAAGATIVAEELTLTNGRRLIGNYDRERGVLVLLNEKTGKRQGEMRVKLEDVASTKPMEITPQATQPHGANGSWLTDYAKARTVATATKRPILIDFTGSDWCGWCVKLDAEVFAKKEFKEWAKDRVVLLKIDFPRRTPLPAAVQAANDQLAQKFGVTGYPTVHVIDAASETSLRKWGYQEGGPQKWVEQMVTGVPALKGLAWVKNAD